MAHHIVICSIAGFYRWFQELYPVLEQEYHLRPDEREYLYDWTICEALSNVVNLQYQALIYSHYKHDIYRCIFDSVGKEVTALLEQELTAHSLSFFKGEIIKVLVAGDTLFIARGDGWLRS